MRYIFIEITEAHAAALQGKLEFKLSEPEPCQVRCLVAAWEPKEPPVNPVHELLRLSYEKLIRVYDDDARGLGSSRYANHKAKTETLLTALSIVNDQRNVLLTKEGCNFGVIL